VSSKTHNYKGVTPCGGVEILKRAPLVNVLGGKLATFDYLELI